MLDTCFIAAGDITWGSSRMRAWWIVPYLDNSAVLTWDQIGRTREIPDARNYVFQKNITPDIIKELKQNNKRVFWDVCDPAWWWNPKPSMEVAKLVDGVVASNAGLAEDFTEWSGVECHVIPDRLELSHFNKRREHKDTEPVRFIWFGISANRIALYGALPNLERLQANGHNISLTIMDEAPDRPFFGPMFSFPVGYVRWTLDTEVEQMAMHDIAILPPYPGPWGRVKSDNKVLTALACGLPWDDGLNYYEMYDLIELLTKREAELTWYDIAEHDVRQSAADWKELLDG